MNVLPKKPVQPVFNTKFQDKVSFSALFCQNILKNKKNVKVYLNLKQIEIILSVLHFLLFLNKL